MSNRAESWLMTTGMRVWTVRISAVLVVASIALAGCSTPEDLFACNLPVACDIFELEFGTSPNARACAGELVASGKPGVLLGTGQAGPWFYEQERLVILRGDGTAVLQTRERECGEDCTTPLDEIPWETPTEQELCRVVIPSDVPLTCPSGGGTSELCGWWPNLADCTSMDPELSCSDAKAILAQ